MTGVPTNEEVYHKQHYWMALSSKTTLLRLTARVMKWPPEDVHGLRREEIEVDVLILQILQDGWGDEWAQQDSKQK